MGHELTVGVSSTGSDQKQQNILVRMSLFWSVALQGHYVQKLETPARVRCIRCSLCQITLASCLPAHGCLGFAIKLTLISLYDPRQVTRCGFRGLE